MTREEEIQQAANDYLQSEGLQCNFAEDNFAAGVFDGIIAGALWADEHPKSPWKDAKNDPPKDTNTVVAIFSKYSIFEKWLCSYNPEEKIWDMSDIICDPPDYWMPIPELPKVKL